MNYGFNQNSYGYNGYSQNQTQNYLNNNYQGYTGGFQAKTPLYTSEEEIKAYILPPNSQIMALDREKPYLYIKSVDGMGRSVTEIFEYKKLDDNVSHETKEEYITRKEFDEFRKQCRDIETLLKVGSNGKEETNN
jgi:hypothetical protein